MPGGHHGGDGTLGDPARHDLDAGLFERGDDRLGAGRGSEVDIRDCPGEGRAEQCIAHNAADKSHRDPGRAQRKEQRLGRGLLDPGLRRKLCHGFCAGSIWPGTIRPFSQRGGT